MIKVTATVYTAYVFITLALIALGIYGIFYIEITPYS
jgi:hypothetical protein|tara:strand:+ start:452 stop:562 length:111 start_codon:yes stop_codon:yes gene_type:complete